MSWYVIAIENALPFGSAAPQRTKSGIVWRFPVGLRRSQAFAALLASA